MIKKKLINFAIAGIVLVFIVTRCVEFIETAMPYEHKIVEKDIVLGPMSFPNHVQITITHPGAQYIMKAYGEFDIRDLDSLEGKKCHIHYLDRKAFGFIPMYKICKLEYNGQVIFDQIMYEGYEYFGERYPLMPKKEWVEEWGD